MFDAVERLTCQEDDWETAGASLQVLREYGITLAVIDAPIAAIAIPHKIQVPTLDHHFSHLKVQLA